MIKEEYLFLVVGEMHTFSTPINGQHGLGVERVLSAEPRCLGVYGLSQYTGYPRIRAIPVYGLSQVNLGVYGLSQYTGHPSIRAIPGYGPSQYTGYPSIRAIPGYGLSQDTGY
ncbi:hypothetical protein DdX_04000 [Ditylenchus destructor]|uniref:Uncharacterized protein n=1 Tax=Ditylenchus destructor TaxID=166010 RepID=A0AAD4NGA9_9BILA|nr:hypothetical protein DdX_04000 [Ditylenchus destructor]